MAAPPEPDRDRDQRPAARRGAAPAAGAPDPNRKRRRAALLLLAALIVIAGVTGIVVAATRSHHTASRAAAAGAGAASAAAQATGNASASAQASAAATSAALPAFGLVGGGGVSPRAAAGNLAVASSVGDVLFAEDGTALDRNARQVIATAAQAIRQHHPGTVTVIGYTDAIGNASTNQQLSLERARAVISALRAAVGGTAVTYRPEAHGQAKPVASNSTATGRQLNRRVVITAS